jgi:hypothetical protein
MRLIGHLLLPQQGKLLANDAYYMLSSGPSINSAQRLPLEIIGTGAISRAALVQMHRARACGILLI